MIPEMLEVAFLHKQDFKSLMGTKGKIYIVGSGSSYSQAIYLAKLFQDYLPYPVIYDNPYSFVRYSTFSKYDVVIHFSQEAKRNDNIYPLLYAKNRGSRTILFTSKKTELSEQVDEVYWYPPEYEKILVASMSYVSGYVAALQYINAQLQLHNKPQIENDPELIIDRVKTALTTNYKLTKDFMVFLYAGYSRSVAVEGALKVNECMLTDSESYELKHYSHGKHFVSYNKPRTYNVLYHEKDQDLVDIYRDTIFEKHHTVNYMKSNLLPELAVFEWSTQMLTYIVQGMKLVNIELEDIPVRDQIRIPHSFTYFAPHKRKS